MKLRIKGNSIRFRLLKSEVERLKAAGTISEETVFGTREDQIFRYAIAVTDGVEVVSAEFSDSQILIMLPETLAMRWFESDQMSIEHEINIDEETKLNILIEKDMVCIDRPDDPDRDDAFPDPKSACKE